MSQVTCCFSNRRLPLARPFLTCLLLVVASFPARAADQSHPSRQQFEAHLSAGEFGLAEKLARQSQTAEERDSLLQQIASRQARAGMFRSALQTAAAIESDSTRGTAFNELSSTPISSPASRGGAALADFDSLIELITATIAPDTWEEVGGPGAIEEFPTGVLVDAAGVMKRIEVEPTAAISLEAARREAMKIRGRDVRRASTLRKVSLTRLERQLQMRWAAGHPPTEAMHNLAGLHRIQYIFFYPDSRDIVLVGPAGSWTPGSEGRTVSVDSGRPVLQLDDLVVVLRNAFAEDPRFGCSITPRKENLAAVQNYLAESAKRSLRPGERKAWLDGLRERLGRQDVSVFGIDSGTRAARVLVEADYRMKLVGMGLEPGTRGVTSYLDSIKVPPGGSPPPMDVLRWWFTLNVRGVRTTEAGDAFELAGTSVQVLSENEMLTARGERVHTGKSTPLNSQFAHSFTKHFADLAKEYTIYADLQNIFDLALVAAIVREHDWHGQIDWQMVHFRDPGKYRVATRSAPREVDTVMNHRSIGKKHIAVGVSGGVRVDTAQLANSIRADEYGLLRGSREQSKPRVGDRWWWD